MRAPRRILLIEGDVELAELTRRQLEAHGYEVRIEHDGRRGQARALDDRWDLVMLDLELREVGGLEICRSLRALRRPEYVPILILTARGSEEDRVRGLDVGADDYVIKPASLAELCARVRALFRRIEHLAGPPTDAVTEPPILKCGELEIAPAARTVRLDSIEVELTAKEFDLLLHFVRSPERVFTREDLLASVWGSGYEGLEHTVNSHINRLRSKINGPGPRQRYIETVWGVGYRLNKSLQE